MRLFCALPAPPDIQAELARVMAPFWAGDAPVRWTAPDAWHVTLMFYGDCTPAQVASIAEGLRRAATGTGGLGLALDALEARPAPPRARVLWAAVEGPTALELLQDRVVRAGMTLGFEPDGRPFRPHLTVGRLAPGARLPRAVANQLGPLAPAPAWLAEALVLYASRPGGPGPRYEILESFSLMGAA